MMRMPGWRVAVLVDSHAHIDMRQYSRDRDQVVQRARDAGVAALVDIGCDLRSSQAAVELAQRYPEVYASVGFHPHSASTLNARNLRELKELAQHPKVVAIGETGLDFYRNLSPREGQIKAFRSQLRLARELGLPVVVHCRQAGDEVFSIINAWVAETGDVPETRGVIHCFSGEVDIALRYIDMGFYISFAGPVTYTNSSSADIARHLPLDKIVIETDCPFLTPHPHRGERNEPSYVSYVAHKIGELKGLTSDVVAERTAASAAQLFGLPL